MRNILITTLAPGICALALAASAEGAEDWRKVANSGRLNWLELRTEFAGVEDFTVHDKKNDQRSNAKLGIPGSLNGPGYPDFELLRREFSAAWNLVRQQSELAAKVVEKRTGRGHARATSTAPELSWGWQHES